MKRQVSPRAIVIAVVVLGAFLYMMWHPTPPDHKTPSRAWCEKAIGAGARSYTDDAWAKVLRDCGPYLK